ncbi:uncharacterized protein GGS22DRAFT_194647 [Annulohypoxylon maeteangense]|uniref:uncharacterized protein n=1 Tax=Annulohypoxylon maeteangense TaxID=1927788 RepID=UPI002007BCB1|nr:uncharacterized protein GGS22DRAFT_194647 [Annulohypoxylon maeteangense]KAI0890750.1 hypothetical protein GGS22DRAFT_194647 [Annulohypoxylon maeteangense]
MLSCRQLPGLSCEECRRRKARCDRVRPHCGTCVEIGIECIVNDKRPRRGPKKGQLKALRYRVGILERQLKDQLNNNLAPPAVEIDCEPMETVAIVSESAVLDDIEQDIIHNLIPNTAEWHDTGMTTTGIAAPSVDLDFNAMDATEGLDISDLVWADLDLLYFDRVHPVLPIIHKRRCFAWSNEEVLTPARLSLRLAMGALAAALSTQFPGLSNILYTSTRRILETSHNTEQDPSSTAGHVPLEEIQAWLLVAHYELMCVHENRAMITAGRAFRLVQLSRLHDIDIIDISPVNIIETPSTPTSLAQDESFGIVEERRRTFWLAFSLDRFLSTRNQWPLTLHEEIIRSRLPSPETHFQNNMPVQVDFLPDILTNSDRGVHSSFTECIILATLYGRCMEHRRLSLASSLSTNKSHEFWTRHERLASILEKQVQILICYPANMLNLDNRNPMLTFSQILVHSAIIHLCITIEIYPAGILGGWKSTPCT